MAKKPQDQDLLDLIQYMCEISAEAEKSINMLHKRPNEIQKKVWLMEQSQIIHEKTHRICGIASQPPLNDLARDQVGPEIARLKHLVKKYRETLGHALPEDY